jgi:hypothetical protein
MSARTTTNRDYRSFAAMAEVLLQALSLDDKKLAASAAPMV